MLEKGKVKMKKKLIKATALVMSSVVCVAFAGCGASGSGDKVTEKYAEYMPDTEEIFSYIEELAGIEGTRQSGTEGGIAAQKYIQDKFEEYGLEDVHVIPTETDIWQCDDWLLEVQGKEMDSYRMYMSLFDGKYAEGGELKTDADGKVSKNNGTYGTFSTSDSGNTEDGEIIFVKDVDAFKAMDAEEIEGKVVASNIKSLYDEPLEYYYAQAMGASAFVGILSEYFDSNKYNPEDMTYVNGSFKIPGYYVTKKVGDEIKAMIKEAEDKGQPAEAHFGRTVNVERTDKAGSVAGILPGKEGNDGKLIMMHSHYDATTPEGATQDGSGSSIVLALAKFYSQIPQEERDRGILFVLNDTHASDYDAHDNVISEYLGGEWVDEEACVIPCMKETDVLADICVEHISEEALIEDNELVFTGNVSPRAAFVANAPEMMKIVKEETENLQDEKNTGTTKIEKAESIVTDADPFWCDGYGIPVVSLISAQPYLYDDCDTLDKVPQRALRPVAESLANIIWRFMSLDESGFEVEK